MSTQPKFRTAQSMLKRTGLFTTLMIAIAVSFMNAPAQSQTAPAQSQTAPGNRLVNRAAITVVKESSSVPPGVAFRIDVTCPRNTIATGGGGEVSPTGLSEAFLTANSPTLSGTTPTGWYIIGANVSSNNLTFSAYAICAQTR